MVFFKWEECKPFPTLRFSDFFLPHNSISFIINVNKSLCKQKENESKQIKCEEKLRIEGKLMPSILSIDNSGSHLESQHLEGCCRKIVSSRLARTRVRFGLIISRDGDVEPLSQVFKATPKLQTEQNPMLFFM